MELVFMDLDGNQEEYNWGTGIGVFETCGQPILGPQDGNNILNPGFIDAFDDGYVYDDGNNTTSIYNGPSRLLFDDQCWNAFSGGDLNGQAPSAANILATEDGLFYNLEADGTLGAYAFGTGIEAADVWAWTNFSVGGALNGQTLSDAVNGLVPNTQFLGIAGDLIVFASNCNPIACDIMITNVTSTDETVPGANDGAITVSATCTTCTTIEYSIDSGMNWQTANVFTGLMPGMYNIVVRDQGDLNCTKIWGGNPVTPSAQVPTLG